MPTKGWREIPRRGDPAPAFGLPPGRARDAVERDEDAATDNTMLDRASIPTCYECQLPMGLAAQSRGQ